MRVAYAQARMQDGMTWDEADKEVARVVANANSGANVQVAVTFGTQGAKVGRGGCKSHAPHRHS